jgi:predicted HTH domain antitoxin
MKSIVLNVPDEPNLFAFDFSVYLAAKLYEDEMLTAGQASSIANLSKRAFIELMGKYGVSPFSTKVEDLLDDISNA